MKNEDLNERRYKRRRRAFIAVSLAAFIFVAALLVILFREVFAPHMKSAESLHAFLDSFGWTGRFILFGLQCLQIIVALIPGEIVELAAGYAYGTIEGTLICLAGVALSSSIVFLLVKKIGAPMVEMFISRERIKEFRFINSEKKLNRLVFLLFFIPGTPKDVLTYFVGLTDMTVSTFLSISLVARIPSIMSSAICGQYLGKEDYLTASIVYVVTGIVSITGYYLYQRIVKKRLSRRHL